ncbi:sorbitol dehydrogenase-like protein, partial [Leptotrombidium deliense]
KHNNEESILAEIHKIFGDKPDISVECSGVESSIRLAIHVNAINATKSGGTVQLVGLGPAEVKVPLVDAACREVDIRGVYAQALELVASGKVDVKPLITDRYKLEQTLDAFEKAKSGNAIKVVIECNLE